MAREKPTAQLQPNSKPTVPTATLVPKKVKRDTPQAQKGTVVAQKVNTHPIFIFQVLPTLAPKVATHNLDQPLRWPVMSTFEGLPTLAIPSYTFSPLLTAKIDGAPPHRLEVYGEGGVVTHFLGLLLVLKPA